MTPIQKICFFVSLVFIPVSSFAENSISAVDEASDTKEFQETNAPEVDPLVSESPRELSYDWAVGFNLAWLGRRDYGAREYRRFSPEFVAYRYGKLPWQDTFWRAGTRLGYTSAQPEMPQSVRIEETDTIWTIEGGLLREWYVVPSFTWGAGYDFRTTKVKTKAPVDISDDRFNRKERLLMWYTQVGVGVPIYNGMFMIEPMMRYHTIEYDDRSHWLFGFETTVGF